MKDYTRLGYAEFMDTMDEYIATLKQGDALSKEEWMSWIRGEANDHEAKMDDDQINWIIEKLEEDGYVREV